MLSSEEEKVRRGVREKEREKDRKSTRKMKVMKNISIRVKLKYVNIGHKGARRPYNQSSFSINVKNSGF